MKKTLISTLVLAATVFGGITSAEAGSYRSSKKIDGQYISIGAEYLDMSVDKYKISGGSPAVVLGYGYRFNRYFELGSSVYFRTEDAITSEFTDTYAIPDHSDPDNKFLNDPVSEKYENTISNSAFVGLHAKASYPISKNIDVYATVGASYGKVQHDRYFNTDGGFLNHKNQASTTEEYLEGIANNKSPCQLTGIESVCGNPIQNHTEEFDSISPSYGLGFRWSWYDSGTFNIINVSAKSLFNKDDFEVFSYGINYEFQF